jgi:hypothetical protein
MSTEYNGRFYNCKRQSELMRQATDLKESCNKLLKDGVIALTKYCDRIESMDDDEMTIMMPMVNNTLRVFNGMTGIMEEAAEETELLKEKIEELEDKIDKQQNRIERLINLCEVNNNLILELKKDLDKKGAKAAKTAES